MASAKGWYWIAVGVLALVVSNSFVNQHGDCLRSFAGRAAGMAQLLSAQALDRVAMAEMMLGKSQTSFARTQTAVARVQVRIASVNTTLARHQVEMVRLQSEAVQRITSERVNRTLARCPRKAITIEIPQPPVIPDDGTI
jgi:hypothetical protein